MHTPPTVVAFVLWPQSVLWVHGSSEEAGRLGILERRGGRWDDEELGGDKLELAGQREEASVERRFGLGLFEDLAMVEVSMSENTPEATGERAKVSMRGRRDVNTRVEAKQGETREKVSNV